MIYRAKLINMGMMPEEASKIMRVIYVSNLKSTKIIPENSYYKYVPVMAFNMDEVIEFAKTKRHLSYFDKFLGKVGR